MAFSNFMQSGGIDPKEDKEQSGEGEGLYDQLEPSPSGCDLGLFAFGVPVGRDEREVTCGKGQRILPADMYAPAAVDAFVVADVEDIHLAVPHTGTATVAAVRINMYADQCELVEKTVDRA